MSLPVQRTPPEKSNKDNSKVKDKTQETPSGNLLESDLQAHKNKQKHVHREIRALQDSTDPFQRSSKTRRDTEYKIPQHAKSDKQTPTLKTKQTKTPDGQNQASTSQSKSEERTKQVEQSNPEEARTENDKTDTINTSDIEKNQNTSINEQTDKNQNTNDTNKKQDTIVNEQISKNQDTSDTENNQNNTINERIETNAAQIQNQLEDHENPTLENDNENMALTLSDIVRFDIPFFKGDPKELNGFINACDMFMGITPQNLQDNLLAIIKAKITGDALSKLQPIEDHTTWALLKTALKTKIKTQITYEYAHENLITMSQKPNETIETYGDRVRKGLSKLNEASRTVSTVQAEITGYRKTHEKLAISRFTQNIRDQNLRTLVEAASKTTLEDTIVFAMEKELSGKNSSIKKCTTCDITNHNTDECKQKAKTNTDQKSKQDQKEDDNKTTNWHNQANNANTPNWQNNRPPNWQMGRTNWQIGRPTNWQPIRPVNYRPTNWQNNRQTNWQNNRSPNWQTDKPMNWQNNRSTNWQYNKPTNWQNNNNNQNRPNMDRNKYPNNYQNQQRNEYPERKLENPNNDRYNNNTKNNDNTNPRYNNKNMRPLNKELNSSTEELATLLKEDEKN